MLALPDAGNGDSSPGQDPETGDGIYKSVGESPMWNCQRRQFFWNLDPSIIPVDQDHSRSMLTLCINANSIGGYFAAVAFPAVVVVGIGLEAYSSLDGVLPAGSVLQLAWQPSAAGLLPAPERLSAWLAGSS